MGPCLAGPFRRRVQLGSPSLNGDEVDGVVRRNCLRTGWRANHAPFVAVGALKKKEFVGVPDTLSGWRGCERLHLVLIWRRVVPHILSLGWSARWLPTHTAAGAA